MKVPLLNLKQQYAKLKNELEPVVLEVLNSAVHVLGPKVQEFEKLSAQYLGVQHAVACANGSDALYLALLALDVQAGDEVITTPFTYIATAEAISQIGAKPIFTDINPETYNLDPKKIEAAITDKTKAIIPVHLYGQCAEMDEIMAIAKKHNLKVIEDAAQAFGSSYAAQTKKAGSLGDIAIFSFYPTKNLGCAGDGGLLSTNSEAIANRLRKIRVHGTVQRYYHDELGVNSRLDEIQAAILLVKLKYISEWNKHRAQIANLYDKAFAAIPGLSTPKVLDDYTHIYHQYTLRVDAEQVGFNRDVLKARLAEAGVASEIYYPLPLHMQEVYLSLGYKAEDLPHALKASQEILCLPIYAELSLEDAELVANTCKEILRKPCS